MNAPFVAELSPIEIEPRPCEWCGLTIERHRMVDDGEGPDFFCEEQIDSYAVNLLRKWEMDDPRDRWRWTGEAPPPAHVRNSDIAPRSAPQHYRTPQATIDEFWRGAGLDDPDYLARWLADHKRDAAHLLKLWKAKQC